MNRIPDYFQHEVVETITYLLAGFGLLEDLEKAEEGEPVKGRYSLESRTEEEDGRWVFLVDIRPSGHNSDDICAVLIGRSGIMLASMQRMFYAALGFRLGGPKSIEHPVWLSVNGRRADLRRANEPISAPPAEPAVVRIAVHAPEGVKVEIDTTSGG